MIQALALSLLIGQAASNSRPAVEIKGQVIFVEVARTPSEWRQGLMFREKLAEKEGMLFFGNQERPQVFWMKNTPLSLDILFIGKNKKIVSIATSTTPLSEKEIPSAKPAQYVLEVPAGFSKRYKIEAGDGVRFINLE